jgi:multiple sugar transport system substrate-binding protein
MKKYTRKISLILIIILISIPLAGCNLPWLNNVINQEDVTLVYWGLWEPDSVMEDVIEKYETLNPNVKIEYTRRPYADGLYKQQLLERLVDPDTNKAPDIMRIHNTWLPEFKDELAPMPTSVYSESQYSSIFYGTALKDFKAEGQLYSIPLMIDTLGLYYNKDLFAQSGFTTPPTDWDRFIEYAQKLTKYDEDDRIIQAGAAMGSSSNVLHSTEILSLLMLQSDIEMVSTDKTRALFDSSNNSQGATVVRYYTNFINRYKVWGTELPNSLDMFIQGKLAMMIAPSWRVFDIQNANPTFEFDTAPIPQITLGKEVNYSTYWGEVVSKDAPNTEIAWDFIKFLSEQEQLRTMYESASKLRSFGEPFPRKDMRDEL